MKKTKFKEGTIVQCTTNGARPQNVVLVTGKGNKKEAGYRCFAGVVVMANGEDDDAWPVGMYSDTWSFEAFKKTDVDISSMIASLF